MVTATRLNVPLYVHCLSCSHPASTRNGQYSDTAEQAISYSNNESIRRGSLRYANTVTEGAKTGAGQCNMWYNVTCDTICNLFSLSTGGISVPTKHVIHQYDFQFIKILRILFPGCMYISLYLPIKSRLFTSLPDTNVLSDSI